MIGDDELKISFLGTSAGEGYPGHYCHCPNCEYAREKKEKNIRVNSSAIVDENLLLDMNTSTYFNIVKMGYSLAKVHTALITHPHEDHLYLDNLEWRRRGKPEGKGLSIESLQKLGSAPRFTPMAFLDIFGNGYTQEAFRHHLPYFEEGEMNFTRIDHGKSFTHKEYKIMSIEGIHNKPGYSTNYIVW